MDEAQEIANLLKMLMEKVDNLEQQQEELKNTMYEQVLNPIKNASEEVEYQDFKDQYGQDLEPYADVVKKIEGDDNFDLYREAYNQHKARPDIETDAFVGEFTKVIENQIDRLRTTLGLSENDKVEVISDSEGEVSVEVNDSPVSPEGEEVETVSETEEVTEPKSGETEVKEDIEAEAEEAPEDEDEKIRAELRAYRDKNLK